MDPLFILYNVKMLMSTQKCSIKIDGSMMASVIRLCCCSPQIVDSIIKPDTQTENAKFIGVLSFNYEKLRKKNCPNMDSRTHVYSKSFLSCAL